MILEIILSSCNWLTIFLAESSGRPHSLRNSAKVKGPELLNTSIIKFLTASSGGSYSASILYLLWVVHGFLWRLYLWIIKPSSKLLRAPSMTSVFISSSFAISLFVIGGLLLSISTIRFWTFPFTSLLNKAWYIPILFAGTYLSLPEKKRPCSIASESRHSHHSSKLGSFSLWNTILGDETSVYWSNKACNESNFLNNFWSMYSRNIPSGTTSNPPCDCASR